jgi:predicted aspartyl protease
VLQRGALRGTLLGMSYLSRLRGFSVENGRLVLKN